MRDFSNETVLENDNLNTAYSVVAKYFATLSPADLERATQIFEDNSSALEILNEWVENSDSWGTIEILPSDQMEGLDGAYSGALDRIFLSSDLFDDNTSEARLLDVIIEELGHRLDALTSSTDTQGDEGKYFAAALRGESVVSSGAEDDAVVLDAQGTEIPVEAAVSISDGGGFEGSNQFITLESLDGGVITYRYEHFRIPDRFIIRYEDQTIFDTGFTGGSRTGTIELPAGTSDQLQIIMATNDSGTAWNYDVSVDTECAPVEPWIFTAEGGDFEVNSDGDCVYDGTVIIGRSDGTGAMLRAENGNFLYNQTTAVITGATFSALIGSDQRSLFTGDVTLDLATGRGTLTETADGDFQLAGLDVTFGSLVIQRDQMGFDAQFRLPEGATGLDIDTRDFLQDGLRISDSGASSAFGFDVTLSDVEFELLEVIEVEAEDIRLSYLSAEDALQLQMRLEFESLTRSDGEDDDLAVADLTGDNFLRVNSDAEVELVGSLEISGSIDLPGGWSIGDIEVGVDTINKTASGTVSIGTPFGVRFGDEGVAVKPEVEVIYDPFEFNSIGLTLDNLNKPIPQYPVLFFQSIGGSVNNLAPAATDDISATLTAGVTLGPQIDGESLGRADVEFEVDPSALNGDIDASLFETEFEVFKIDIAEFDLIKFNGDFELDWNAGTFATNAVLEVADGLFTTSAGLRFDRDFNFSTSGQVALNFPDWVPGVGGDNIANANFALKFTNDDNYSNDYVSVWYSKTVEAGFFSPARTETKGIRIGFDADIDWINNGTIPITSSWFIEGGQDFVTLTAYWQNDSTTAAVQVVRPDGAIIDEADFAANGIEIVNDLTTATTRTVAIQTPVEGTWDLLVVDETGLGNVEYYATQQAVATSLTFGDIGEVVDADTYKLSFELDSRTATSNVSFFIDEDPSALDGLFIGEGDFASGSHSIDWDTAGFIPEDYFVYALVDDGVGAPITVISDSSVKAGSEANLKASIEAATDAVLPGGSTTFTVTVTNNSASGISSGTRALVNLTGPITLSDSELTANSSDFAQFEFTLPQIAAGEASSFTFDVDVDSAAPISSVVTADVYVLSDSYDPDASDDADLFNIVIDDPNPPAVEDVDLSVTSNLADQVGLSLGDAFSYAVTVANDGTTTANNVTLRELVPNATDIDSTTSYINSDGAVVFNLGDLDAGEQVTVEISGEAAAVGSLRATSSVDSDQTDVVLIDNELLVAASVSGATVEAADLYLTTALGAVAADGSVELSVTVGNDGPGVGSGIEVGIDLPAGATVESQSALQGTYDTTTGVWSVGNVRDNLERTLVLTLVGSAVGQITAEVIAVSEGDPDSTPDDGMGDDFSSLDLMLGSGIEVIGTDGNDTIDGSAGDDTLDGGGGDDLVRSAEGNDGVTLGAGEDTLSGTAAELDGDTVSDFTGEDSLFLEGVFVVREDIDVTFGSAILDIDTDNDAASDVSLTLEGDFTAGDFMAARTATGTQIAYEQRMTALAEGEALEAGQVNGIINAEYLSGTNATDMIVIFQTAADAEFNNSVGYYEITDTGTLENVTILAQNTKTATGPIAISAVDADNDIGFFLIQNGEKSVSQTAFDADEFSFVTDADGGMTLAEGGAALQDVEVFFSHDAALNSDGLEHVVSGVSNDGQGALRIAFEDRLRDGSGDDDFQDVILYVDIA